MTVFGLNDREVNDWYANAAARPYDPESDPGPEWYSDAGAATMRGVHQGLLGTQLLLTDVRSQLGAETDTAERERLNEYMKELRPDPKVTGWLGNVLQNVSAVGTQAALGGAVAGPLGAAETVALAQGNAKTAELVSEGIDSDTAQTVGVIEGVAQGAGVVMPAAVPGKLLTRIGSGAGINVGVGMVQRGVTGSVLEDAGYPEMAAQYRVLDGAAILTDMILGAGFGALHEGGGRVEPRREPLPSEIDAALAANDLRHLEIETAPGIPADIATRNAHIDRLDRALTQVLRGEPVDVAGGEMNFLAHPESPARAEAARLFSDELHDLETSTALPDLPKSGEPPLTIPESAEVLVRAEHPDLFTEMERVQGQAKQIGERAAALEERVGTLTPEEMAAAETVRRIDAELKATDDPRRIKRLERTRREALDEHAPEKQRQIEMRNELEVLKERQAELAPEMGRLQETAKGGQAATAREMARNAATVDLSAKGAETGPPKAPGTSPGRESPASGTSRPEPIEASTAASHQIAAEKPDLSVVDEEGNVVTAAEALAKADGEITQAERDGSLFDAAITCFLRFGGGE